MPNEKIPNKTGDIDHEEESPIQFASNKVKFEIYGEEMIEKARQAQRQQRQGLSPPELGRP